MGLLRITRQWTVLCLLAGLILPNLTSCDVQRGEQEGYYAFEEAPSRFMRPPQVRKPPYMRSNLPCPDGEVPYSKRPSPKYTLCGDLNKGFIPANPIGQSFDGEPYPFDLIKNKTLVFLSKALPYLKDDPKIPKVTKIGPKNPGSYKHHGSQDFRKHVYGHQRGRREANVTMEGENDVSPETVEALHEIFENQSTARQNCDQGGASGLLCTLSSAMSNNKIPLALMTAMAQNLIESMKPTTPAPPEPSTPSPSAQQYSTEYSSTGGGSSSSASMTEAVVNLLSTLANMGLAAHGPGSVKDSADEEPSTLAHVMSVLTGASPGSSSALSVILKLMASDSSPLKALAGGTRKRRPVGEDMAASETTSTVRRPQDNNDFDLPPTPCPSSEEYVTPTFARNYQGVWKYVVQIPQEGYFTQTVQQTKCLKGRCDFMDGICHESPRWVSLLVAETYYPDSFYPSTSTAPPPPPPVEDFYNFQQYLRRRVGEEDGEEDAAYRSRPVYQEKPKPHQHCDGVDQIGCFVVRLYYDWFLVNGSCKCWKPSPKRILTGRR